MKLTNEELIAETVSYIEENGRASEGEVNKCSYCTSDGKMCAVGRLLQDPLSVEREHGGEGWGEFGDPRLLKPEYQHFQDGILVSLQNLHDSFVYWEPPQEEGKELQLTETGKARVQILNSYYAS